MRKKLIPLLLAILLLPMAMNAQTHYTLSVGNGTATNPYMPSYGYYNYSYSQMLYTMGEVGIDGDIDTIAFHVSSGSSTRTISIYMAEVSRTSFSSTSDAVAAADFHLVYSGSVSWSAGWVTIALDSIFTYSDTGSLVIAATDNGTWASGYPYFSGTEMSNNRSLYAYNDNNSYSLGSSLSSSTTFLPNIRLGISSYSSYCAAPSNVTVSDINNDEATISWHENGNASSYELVVSDVPVTDFSMVSGTYVNDTTYTITGLSGNTLYYVYVRAVCGSDSYSAWTNATTFRSACVGGTSIPYSTGFEDLATAQLPNCWLQVAQGSSSASTFPAAYAYAPNARNSNVYFEFESSSGETEIAAMPVMDNINMLQFSFYASLMNNNFTFEVGVMEDTVFVPVDTVALTAGSGGNWAGSYYPYTVYFNEYTGSGDRIAMRVTASGSYTLMMDDFVVTEIPSCLSPTRLAVDSIGGSWAALSWHDNASANGWEVLYATADFDPDTVTESPVVAYDTTVVLTGLLSGTRHYAYVRANCGDYSPWAGPLTFTPGQYNMRMSGSDTVRTCGLLVYDNGGPDGEYSTGSDFTLVVYPSSNDSVVTCWGSYDIYAYYARLRIYEGVGTDGTPIWQSNQSNYSGTIPFIRSNAGPITVRFTGGSYNYGYNGFELHTGCAEAPQCAVITNLEATSVGTGSAFLAWNVAGRHFGEPVNYEIEYTDLGTAVANTVTSSTTSAILTGLTANTAYRVRVRPECDGNVYGGWDSIDIATLHLPCVEFDTTIADSVTITGDVPATAYTIPVNNFYNYSYTQQLVAQNEMTGATLISGIDFDYAYSSANTDETNCTIYLANTEVTSLSDGFVPYDSTVFVQVYSGPLICQTGWNHFEFDSAFYYDGAGSLLVAVLDNSGNYNGSAYVFNGHTVTGMARHIYNDNSAYDITTVSGGSSSTFRSNMRLHIAGCSQQLSCGRPIVMVDTVGADLINLSWAPGYQETSWDVDYMAEGDTVWTTEGTTTSTSYSFPMLTPDTRYYFRITANCADTLMATQLSARTICIPNTLPFVYGFETYPSGGGQAPSCWHAGTSYEWYAYPEATTYQAHTGSTSLYMYSSSGTHTYVALPAFAAALDSLELTFWLYKEDNYDPHEVCVGVMTDAEDFSTFVPVATVSATAVSTWDAKTVHFDNYTGNGHHIAIATTDDFYSSPYIDDITVDYIRPCPRIENVTAANISINDATITWNGAGNTSFEIEYGPSGFGHDSGTVVTSTLDTVFISGLAANTEYDVYVRTFCASGDTSSWSNVYSFRTNCVLIDSIPFAEGFESVPAGWGNYNSPNFYPCWNRHINSSDNSFYPYIYSYSSHTGSNGLYWYWDSYNGVDYYLTLPGIDTTAIPYSNLQINFWAMNNSSYADNPVFIIGAMSGPDAISTFQPIDTVEVVPQSWFLYEIPLNSYTGNGTYITIKSGATSGNGYWYAYMDDISLGHIPTCAHVTDLAVVGNTPSSVSLDWNEGGSATTWEVAIDTLATATPVADTTINDSSFVTIGGLTSGTFYYFWVRAICGAGDTSDWEGPVLGVPNVWMMRPNQTDTIHMCGGAVFDDGGPSDSYANNQNSTLIIMPDGPNSIISISGSYYLESCCDSLVVYDGTSTSGTRLFGTRNTSSGNIPTLTSSASALTLYFHSDGSVTYDGFNISVNCIHTHCLVGNLRLSGSVPASDSQLAVEWDTNGALSYEVEYGNAGFTQGTGTLLTTYTNNVVITGLSGLTNYDVYVRSICGIGDTGMWVHSTFQTSLCDNVTEIYNYDSTMSTTTTSYGPIGYSLYNYSYVQTIIDSAQMVGLTDPINAFAFNPINTTSSNYYTHMTVYMANIPESSFSGGFIYPDSNHVFVPVLNDADLNFSVTGWQLHGFDTTFTWDGHSNVLFAVNRQHGSWSSSGLFAAHNTSSAKTCYVYNDGSPYNINTVSGGTTGNYAGDIKFFSCPAAGCRQPVITGVSYTYEDATITWTGEGTAYEVNVKESAAPNWPATDIHVTGNTYTFTGLQPTTNYTFRVRQDCTGDSLGYSNWVIDGVLTDSLPCLTPDSLHVTAVTNATATFDWMPIGAETAWDIHVWYSGGLDSIYTVSTRPATVGGFTANTTYNASIRPLCGSAHNIIGEWGDTVSFTTAVCPDVTGLTAGNVTANSVELTWINDPLAVRWTIEYGYHGFDLGTGTTISTTSNNYVVSGLIDEMQYDFRVRAVCGDNWESEGWATVTATTAQGTVTCDAPTNVSAVVAGNSATVSWTAGAGNISFELEYGPHGFAHGTGITATAATSPYTLPNLEYETEYDVYVKAICAQNYNSAWSVVASFTTEAQGSEDCDPVTDLAASNVTESAALLTWTPGNSGDEWEVVLTTSDGTTVSEASTTEHQFQLTSLTPGTAYVAKVRTVCGDGQYSTFASTSFTTLTVGIDRVVEPACAIYPNPTSGSTTVSVSGISGKVRIAIVDMNGREVVSETLDCSGDCAKTMNVENLAQGAYFVRVTGENANMVRKLIVR